MLESTTFVFGERKRVTIVAKSFNEVPFEVTSASWELRCGEDLEDSGECEVSQEANDRVLISAVVQPQRKNAVYILRYTYEIGSEILIYEIKVRTV